MRNIKSYFHRRKIKDIPAWLNNLDIHDMESFKKFCEVEQLSFDEQSMLQYFQVVPEPKQNTVSKESSSASADTWHVPAAERPIKRAPSRAVTAKKSSPKAKPAKKRATKRAAKKD